MHASPRPRRRAFLIASALAGLGISCAPMVARAEITVTDQDVVIHEWTSDTGFQHPGVGITAAELRNLRTQVAARQEPWHSYAGHLAQSSRAGLTISPRNRSATDPALPRTRSFDVRGTNTLFIEDALIAYTQAVMFVLTGESAHRANAMAVIRLWSQMDPGAYAEFTDSHIHTGIPMHRMAMAAELMRCTSAADGTAEWTDADLEAFGTNLVRPVIETFQSRNDHFMNQHLYPLLGATAGAILLDDQELYARSVEWTTVNASAADQGFNGAILRLYRLVEQDDITGEPLATPRVQHMEMGRDQAHGGGDLNNTWMLARLLLAQGTRVDPVAGTISTAADAVGPYELGDDRILAAADYFWSYMLGHEPEWTPVAYAISPDGTIRDTYRRIAPGYRGRYLTANFWDLYSYYVYERGIDLQERAPYFLAAFRQRFEDRFYAGGSMTSAWENVDGGGDFWLHIPAAAAADGAALLARPTPSAPRIRLADRCTVLTGTATIARPADAAPYLQVSAGKDTVRIAVQSASAAEGLALDVRTDGPALLRIGPGAGTRKIVLPDTGGAWRAIALPGGFADHQVLEVSAGSAVSVDIGELRTDAAQTLTPPAFDASSPARAVGVAGEPLRLDIPASDPDPQDVLARAATGLPRGARLDADSGSILVEHPSRGSWTTTVQVDDGSAAAARTVRIDVAPNREKAIALAHDGYDPDAAYVSWTLAAWEQARDAARAGVRAADRETFAALLARLVAATDALELLTPLLDDGTIAYADLVTASTLGMPATIVTDGDPTTSAWYGMAQDLTHTLRFGPDFAIRADAFGLQGNIFDDRIATTIVLGSQDGQEWTRLTPQAAAQTQDYQVLEVDPALRDRTWTHLRLHLTDPQPDVLYGIVRNLMEVSELHIQGERVETGNVLTRVSLSSEDALAGKIRVGDGARLEIASRVPLGSLDVTLGGAPAQVELAADGLSAVATAAIADRGTGTVDVSVTGTRADGTATPALTTTTDGTSLQVGGDAALALTLGEDASIIASAPQWPGGALDEEAVAALLHDRDGDTFGDLTVGAGSFYRIDVADGARFRVEELYALPRASHPARLDGAHLEGSHDGETWVDVTAPIAGAAAGVWSVLRGEQILVPDAFPHLRLISHAGWNGDVAEIELYGQVEG